VRFHTLLPLLSLLLLACAGSPGQPGAQTPVAPSTVLGQPLQLAIGQPVTIVETGLRVGFLGVPEDSRCPSGVQCVWAGRVTVELEVQAPNAAAETIGLSSDARHHVYAGQAIDLRGVTPAPGQPGVKIGEADYRAEIVVTAS
jgi:hypothetical protein